MIEIKCDGERTRVFKDGEELKRLTKVEFVHSAGEKPCLWLTENIDISEDVNCEKNRYKRGENK